MEDIPTNRSFLMNVTIIKDAQVCERLGGGNFSDVFRGIWQVNIQLGKEHIKSNYAGSFKIAKSCLIYVSLAVTEYLVALNLFFSSLNHPNVVR